VKKSQGLDASGQNKMMVGRQKLSLLDKMFLDFFE
jgi:hypothetical protein